MAGLFKNTCTIVLGRRKQNSEIIEEEKTNRKKKKVNRNKENRIIKQENI